MRRLVVAVVVLVGLLVAADRIAAVLASQQVASEAARAAPECSRPGVDIGGFPFLTQAIAGRYDHVTLTTTCAGRIDLRRVRVDFYGAHLGLGQIVQQDVERIPVDRASGRVTIPFAALDQQIAGQRLTVGPGPHHAIEVTGTVSVAGRSVSAHGSGSLSVSGGELHIAVGSLSTPAGTIDAGGAFDVALPLPALPFHLTRLRTVATRYGVVLSGAARHLVLKR